MKKEGFKPLADALVKLEQGRAERKTSKPKSQGISPQLSLELWPDAVRGVPNAVLRGALFTVNKTRVVAVKRELLAAVDGLEVRFKGERFNQIDLDVWEALLHLGRMQPLGGRIEFSAHAFLKALGRGTSGKEHEQLKEEIVRLRGGTVEVTWIKEGKTFIGGLIEKAFRDEVTQNYVVILDEKMLGLYEGGYSHIDWQQRRALGQGNLAKWLHGFYATHAKPFPYKIDTIKKLCGSTASPKEFKRLLKAALDQLIEVGAITKWEIKDDLVSITKIPTASQRKHLNGHK